MFIKINQIKLCCRGAHDSRETFKRAELLKQKHYQLTAEEENLERLFVYLFK